MMEFAGHKKGGPSLALLRRAVIHILSTAAITGIVWTNAHAQVPRVIAGGPISSFQHEFSKDGLVLTFHTQGDTVVGSPMLSYQLRAFRNGQPYESTPQEMPLVVGPHIVSATVPWAGLRDTTSFDCYVKFNDLGGTSINSPRMIVDLSYVSSLESAEAARRDAVATIADLRSQLEARDNEMKELARGTKPSYVRYVSPPFVSDDTATVVFQTDVPSKLRAFVRGPGGYGQQTTDLNITTDHRVTFNGLASATVYQLDAVALSLFDNTPTAVKANPPLSVTTRPRIDAPRLSQKIAASDQELSLILTVDQKAFVRIECTEYIDTVPGAKKVIGQLDDLSAESAVPLHVGDNTMAVGGLRPNSKYLLKMRVANEFHKEAAVVEMPIDTLPTPKALAFDSPLNVTVSPTTGIAVGWNANIRPTEAFLDVLLPSGARLEQPATIDGVVIKAQVDVEGLKKVLGASTKVAPILRARMNDGRTQATSAFTLSYTLPSKEEIDKSPLSNEVKESLTLLCHLRRGGLRLKLTARLNRCWLPATYWSATISRIQARTAGRVGRGASGDRRRSNCRKVKAAAVRTVWCAQPE